MVRLPREQDAAVGLRPEGPGGGPMRQSMTARRVRRAAWIVAGVVAWAPGARAESKREAVVVLVDGPSADTVAGWIADGINAPDVPKEAQFCGALPGEPRVASAARRRQREAGRAARRRRARRGAGRGGRPCAPRRSREDASGDAGSRLEHRRAGRGRGGRERHRALPVGNRGRGGARDPRIVPKGAPAAPAPKAPEPAAEAPAPRLPSPAAAEAPAPDMGATGRPGRVRRRSSRCRRRWA